MKKRRNKKEGIKKKEFLKKYEGIKKKYEGI
jgi:hypothetical protein